MSGAGAKTCGACSFCCKVLEIAELSKPSGRWCPHARPGKGCAIHGAHPASCQGFACSWLLDPQMPDAFRPDRSKVVLRMDRDARRITADCDPALPNAWRAEPMYGLLKENARRGWGAGYLVYAKAGQHMWLVAPDRDIELGEVEAGSPLTVAIGADGEIRVTVGPPGSAQ